MNWQKIKVDLLLAFFSHFFYKTIGYIVLMVLIRYLPKEEMGIFFFVAALATFFALFTELGMNTYLLRKVAEQPKKALSYFSEVISLRLLCFIVYLLLVNGFALIFKPDIFLLIFLTSLYVFLEEFYLSYGALFLALKRIIYNVLSGVSAKIFLVGGILAVVLYQGNLTAIVTCYLLANVALVGVALYLVQNNIGHLRLVWEPQRFWRLLRTSLPFFILSVLGLVHAKVDTLMLGLIASYAEVAIYEAGYKLLEASQFVVRPVDMIFFPTCSEIAARHQWQELRVLFRNMLLVVGVLGGAITVGVVSTAGWIIPAILGPQYEDTIAILRILVLNIPILYIMSVGGLVARSLHLEKTVVKIMLISMLVNIMLNSVSIPLWGALGAAWTTLISEMLYAVCLVRMTIQTLRALCTTAPTKI